MTKFKIGDKVKCVKTYGVTDNLSTHGVYTVLKVGKYNASIMVNDGSNTVYGAYRFELVAAPKTNQWQVYDDVPPRHSSCEYHTMPNGVVMWRTPDPVIADHTMRFSVKGAAGGIKSYICSNSWEGHNSLKGKTKDGKPFGTWTVDFGGE